MVRGQYNVLILLRITKVLVALEMEAVGSLNSLVDYVGLGDSDIEDLDEEAFEKKATAIVARS